MVPKGTLKACFGTKRNAQGLLGDQKERSRLALGTKGTLKACIGSKRNAQGLLWEMWKPLCGRNRKVRRSRQQGSPLHAPEGLLPVRIAPPPARALRASRAPGAARLSPQARDRARTCRNSLQRRGPPARPGTAAAQPRTAPRPLRRARQK